MAEHLIVGYIGAVLFLLLVAIGVRLGFAALLTGFVGIWILVGYSPAVKSLATAAFGIVANYTYSVIPMFILMGYFSHYAGFADDLFAAARKWVGHLPGGLLVATILGAAGFAAVCGSSVAAAGILTKVCLPELEKHNYDRKLSIGCLASAGTLAIMIPPSITMVVYCLMVEQPVAQLLIAGIIPGILTAVYYSVYVIARARLQPSLAPPVEGVPWAERIKAIWTIWPMILVAATIIGGLYTGYTSASEAGAVGAMVILIVAIIRKRLPWAMFKESLIKTLGTTSMLLMCIIGVLYLSRFFAYSQVTSSMSQFLLDLPVGRYVIMAFIFGLYFILGMFMEPFGMMALTLPVVFPAVVAMGFSPIWFGVIVVVESELSMLTPPVGLNLFVVSGVARHIPFTDIVRGVVPFVIIEFVVLATLLVFPQIALYLPSLMK